MKKRNLIILITVLILTGVITFTIRKTTTNLADNLFDIGDTLILTDLDYFLGEKEKNFDEIAKNIASPVEIAASIKEYDFEYFNDILLNTKTSKYIQSHDKALALGGIGVDLMYVNFYEKRSEMLVPLNQIRNLSSDLRISQFFDYALLKELTNSNLVENNIDTIIYLTTYNLNRIEEYLMESDRMEIGLFMVIGAWTEGIHLLSEYAYRYNDERIYERLAEQQFFIIELRKMLDQFKENKYAREVSKEMEPLEKLLGEIEFIYENVGKPWKTVDINGNEVWYQWKKSIAQIDKEQVRVISKEVKIFRNNLFKLNT